MNVILNYMYNKNNHSHNDAISFKQKHNRLSHILSNIIEPEKIST